MFSLIRLQFVLTCWLHCHSIGLASLLSWPIRLYMILGHDPLMSILFLCVNT
ncbi:hypothetical protein C0J52_03203 [Blattella germanica]|nr:hypothetical protein C0J52_03203 [Blattella germanica]